MFYFLSLLILCSTPSDDEILSKATERILSHRTGDLILRVVDKAGKPVRDAEIVLEQKKHDFLFGCNIFALNTFRDPKKETAYRKYFKGLFNYATLPFYWSSFEPVKGRPGYEKVARMAKWCRENGITPKGHPLVWNHPAGVPVWLPHDTDEVHKLLVERVEACTRHFRGQINMWDVVNEATDPFRFKEKPQVSDLIKKIGIKKYLLDSFHAARKGNPKAFLLINDYRVGQKYCETIEKIRENNNLLCDCIGIQSHMHGGVWPAGRIWDVCERFSSFGRPIHFTETTIVSGRRLPGRKWGPTESGLEEKQARQAAMFYTMIFSHPYVTALTWWDFSDARAWQGAAAGFLRKDCSPKPVYNTLHKLIKGKWWTNKIIRTDNKGVAETSAFFGNYVVSVRTKAGKTITRKIDFPRPWPPPVKNRAVKKLLIRL